MIRSLWRRARLLAGTPLYRPGLRRYRNIEEADAAREGQLDERVRWIRSSRPSSEASRT